MATSATVRLVVVMLFGLFFLQTSGGVGTLKLIFMGLLIYAWMLSLLDSRRADSAVRPDVEEPIDKKLYGFLVVAGFLFLTSVVADSSATTDWMDVARGSVPFVMALLLPLVGASAGASLSVLGSLWVAYIVGLGAAIAFFVDWTARRGVSVLAIDRLAASSLLLPGLGLSVSLVFLFHYGPRLRAVGIVGAVAIPALMLATGTRTNLLLFVVPVFMLLWDRSVPVVRRLIFAVMYPLILFLSLLLFSRLLVSDSEFLLARVSMLWSSFGQGDQSFSERSDATANALAVFKQSPVFGEGVNYAPRDLPAFDTPLATLARLGIVGFVALIIVFVGLILLALRSRSSSSWRSSPLLLASWLLFVACTAFLGSPVDDRGFAFSVAMLVAIAVAEENRELCPLA